MNWLPIAILERRRKWTNRYFPDDFAGVPLIYQLITAEATLAVCAGCAWSADVCRQTGTVVAWRELTRSRRCQRCGYRLIVGKPDWCADTAPWPESPAQRERSRYRRRHPSRR